MGLDGIKIIQKYPTTKSISLKTFQQRCNNPIPFTCLKTDNFLDTNETTAVRLRIRERLASAPERVKMRLILFMARMDPSSGCFEGG